MDARKGFYYIVQFCPVPGALALLGVAGMISIRRRRA